MKKIKQENRDAIKSLEFRIEILDKEIDKRNIDDQDDKTKKENEGDKEHLGKQNIVCKHYNCKYKIGATAKKVLHAP